MVKIIDCFTFYNEVDILNYRLNILNDVVDYFIIVESTHTFSGIEKKLIFLENTSLFEKFKDKIIHIIVDDFPYTFPNINYEKKQQWENEYHQRNKISSGIEKLNLSDEDVITITDVDEIPDPNTLGKIKTHEINVTINNLHMIFYYYNLNSIIRDDMLTSKIISYGKYKELSLSIQDIRTYNHRNNVSTISNGGWHLSCFGDANFIQNKLQTFSHQEANIAEFTDLKKIQYRIDNFLDLLDNKYYDYKIKKISIKDNKYLPPHYEIFLKKFIIF